MTLAHRGGSAAEVGDPSDLAMTQFEDQFPLKQARAHEVFGPGAVVFAAICAGMATESVLWVVEDWPREQLNPLGLLPFCDPSKLIMARGKDHTDVLAAAEEGLRSKAVGMVIAELGKPLDLRQGRRLQLAAEAGQTTGLFIISEDAGSNATQTRWKCSPQFDTQDSTLQLWELIKNKEGTLRNWMVRWDAQKHCVIVVSQTGE